LKALSPEKETAIGFYALKLGISLDLGKLLEEIN